MNRLFKLQSFNILAIILLVCFVGISNAQEKKKINKLDDLPRHTYPISMKASELVVADEEFKSFANDVRKDIKAVMNEYEITDKTTLKRFYAALRNLYMLEGKAEQSLEMVKKLQALQEKPADKLTSGFIYEAIIKAWQETNSTDPEKIREVFKTNLSKTVEQFPWDVVSDEIERMKGNYEIISKNLIIGQIQSGIDPSVEKVKNISGDIARRLIGQRRFIEINEPLKNEIVQVLSDYINAHKVVKADIWKERDVDLSDRKDLNTVMVGIWDSGVDAKVFKDQMFKNKNEKIDGEDNDNNGFVDDVHGIAFSLREDKSPDLLHPLSEDDSKKLSSMMAQMKGIMDIQAAVNSEEAGKLKKQLSSMKPEEVEPFIEKLNLFGLYAHGTHVAGIATANNPFAKVLGARVTFDYHAIPDPSTVERARKAAKNYSETVKYFRANNVRVVNMSWGWEFKEIEGMLEANGIGETAEIRREKARVIFDIYKEGLYEAIKSAPEILFITAAGNSDSDVAFDEVIPSSFDLPNLLTVGAVDQAGEETSFTSFGETVDLHANGFEVMSYLPGGERMAFSGTSMASPNVVNLAGKLLALNSSLTVDDLIALLKKGAEKSENGRCILINPKSSVALLKDRS